MPLVKLHQLQLNPIGLLTSLCFSHSNTMNDFDLVDIAVRPIYQYISISYLTWVEG